MGFQVLFDGCSCDACPETNGGFNFTLYLLTTVSFCTIAHFFHHPEKSAICVWLFVMPSKSICVKTAAGNRTLSLDLPSESQKTLPGSVTMATDLSTSLAYPAIVS